MDMISGMVRTQADHLICKVCQQPLPLQASHRQEQLARVFAKVPGPFGNAEATNSQPLIYTEL